MPSNKKAETRVPPIIHAYINDLVETGLYGTGPADVVRALIEAGIRDAIAKEIIKVRRTPQGEAD